MTSSPTKRVAVARRPKRAASAAFTVWIAGSAMGCNMALGLSGYTFDAVQDGGTPDVRSTKVTGSSAPEGGIDSARETGADAAASVPDASTCDVDLATQCYSCVPTVTVEFLNACTSAACVPFDDTRVTHLLPDGGLPPLDASNIFAGPLLWEAFGKLAEAVRADGSVLDKHAETPSNAFWETFARSSAALAFPAAAVLAELLAPIAAAKKSLRVLDVAAGSGIYGYTQLRTPGVDVTFVDWPNVLEETRAWGDRLGVDRSRAHYLPGSVFEADLGGPYDVVIASHLYHHFDPKTCQALTRRLAGTLAPGGRLAVHDFVTGSALENPGATMFSLVMLVWTRHGKAYAQSDYATWMSEAGLSRPSAHPLPGLPTTWLIADAPSLHGDAEIRSPAPGFDVPARGVARARTRTAGLKEDETPNFVVSELDRGELHAVLRLVGSRFSCSGGSS